MMESTPIFEERQRFTQPWIWILLGLIAGAMGVSAVIVLRCPQHATRDVIGLIVGAAIVGLTMVFMRLLELHVRVSEDGLYVGFFPFVRKHIALADIRAFTARTYRPILEFGGWGIRYGFSAGWAYNVRGNRGVQLELTNGKKILIGSQRADELARALQQARGK